MIKNYNNYIIESNQKDSYFLQTYEETKVWLDKYNFKNYTIDDNLIVNIDGNVNIREENIIKLEVQFGIINGSFTLSDNKLISLKGSPNIVYGSFNCDNNYLLSLKYCPTKVEYYVSFSYNDLQNINDLHPNILIDSIEYFSTWNSWFDEINVNIWDNYFEYWINKNKIKLIPYLKDKVSDNMKEKYCQYFKANNFDLI